MHRKATLAVAESGRCIGAFLFLLYVNILRISPQHKHRDGAYPYASTEIAETSCVIIRSIEEVAVCFGQSSFFKSSISGSASRSSLGSSLEVR